MRLLLIVNLVAQESLRTSMCVCGCVYVDCVCVCRLCMFMLACLCRLICIVSCMRVCLYLCARACGPLRAMRGKQSVWVYLCVSESQIISSIALLSLSPSLALSFHMTVPTPSCLWISSFNTLQRMSDESSTEKKQKRHMLRLGKRKNHPQIPHIAGAHVFKRI